MANRSRFRSRLWNRFFKIACCAALLVTGLALDTEDAQSPRLRERLLDTLDAATQDRRSKHYCANLERVTGVQMALVTVDTLDGEPIEDVANVLYREWGIGKKGKNEGDSVAAGHEGPQEPRGSGLRPGADSARRIRRRHPAGDAAGAAGGPVRRSPARRRARDGRQDRHGEGCLPGHRPPRRRSAGLDRAAVRDFRSG